MNAHVLVQIIIITVHAAAALGGTRSAYSQRMAPWLVGAPSQKVEADVLFVGCRCKRVSVACSKFALRVLVFLVLALGVKADVLLVGEGYS